MDGEPEPTTEHIAQEFIDRMFSVVEALLAMSGQHQPGLPEVGMHLASFAEHVAGVAVEAVCTWPTPGIPSCSTV
jgi:hypothetical protein